MSRFGLVRFAICLVIICSAFALQSATTGFVVPEIRGDANTGYGYWEFFPVDAAYAVTIAPDQAESTTGALLIQQTPGAVVTGSGNIYNPAGASLFEIADSTSYSLGTVILQVRSSGTELDYGSVTLSYDTVSGVVLLPSLGRVELDRQEVSGFGYNVSSLWQWDLTGLAVTDYTLAFTAAGPHLSLDSIQLDTAEIFRVVPEPSSMALIGIGLTTIALRKRIYRNH